MKRRDFLKLGASGVATVFLSNRIPFLGTKNSYAAGQVINVTITDAMKNMVTHNSINTAQCYFWIYQMHVKNAAGVFVDVPPDCPGPTIMAVKGDSITLNITNNLDENHSFFIPGSLPTDPPMFDSGAIPPGGTVSKTFTASQSGAFLYYDNLNDPVNRVMGLHGALVVRPAAAVAGHKFTPYDNPTPHVQNIYDAFGTTDYWPGLAWEEGDPTNAGIVNPAPPFRTYVWLDHQASPRLFAEVGNFTAGLDYPPQQFLQKFLRDTFSPNSVTAPNFGPQYFTINGQSGFFSHFSPSITPMNRVGEPVVIHILNAGLWEHSMHIHCNHVYITSINGAPNPNPIWVDVYTIRPMDRIDYTIPYMRPPDNANVRGIGRPDAPLKTISGHSVWPPVDEFQVFIPPQGTTALAADGITPIDMGQRMSPLCFPMHDHSEASQTAQGGNYNCGLISGMYVIGDRNAQSQGLGNFRDFPMDADFAGMFRNIRGVSGSGAADPNGTGLAAGPRPNG